MTAYLSSFYGTATYSLNGIFPAPAPPVAEPMPALTFVLTFMIVLLLLDVDVEQRRHVPGFEAGRRSPLQAGKRGRIAHEAEIFLRAGCVGMLAPGRDRREDARNWRSQGNRPIKAPCS